MMKTIFWFKELISEISEIVNKKSDIQNKIIICSTICIVLFFVVWVFCTGSPKVGLSLFISSGDYVENRTTPVKNIDKIITRVVEGKPEYLYFDDKVGCRKAIAKLNEGKEIPFLISEYLIKSSISTKGALIRSNSNGYEILTKNFEIVLVNDADGLIISIYKS